MTQIRKDDELQALLRQGDPAGDSDGPSLEEIAEMRRTVLNAISERRWIHWVPIAAATAALALAVILVSSARLGEQSADTTLRTPTAEDVEPGPMTAGNRRQQIQFATENGTRIIWVLDPDLKL